MTKNYSQYYPKNYRIFQHTLILFFLIISSIVYGINDVNYISKKYVNNAFPLITRGQVTTVHYSANDYDGVIRAIGDLQSDLEKVSGTKPQLSTGKFESETAIIIGTIGHSEIIDKLIENNKINVSDIKGKWETFIIQSVTNPLNGVKQALIITGSDKRGTIFGIYDLAEKIGVSPWYWWADVPVEKSKSLFVIPGRYTLGEPKVKYRGIFINDEAPALTGWATEKFGGFNHQFYSHVFELILRLKGNFLWPAMWGSAFYDDDSLNAPLANEYGIVISTSHHEPLMRAHDEWRRYGSGPWNYETNSENLKKFWKKGIERMDDNESIVTIGMRGDGDKPMSDKTAITLLEKIVKDQQKIIADVTGKPAEETPQVWALYKEVQEYYDKGMRVPDDVTLLLCDDNWGNVRILPDANAEKRKGGYGMYYHFDFVGGPRSYKWLNTVQIERVWEQMHLTWKYGVDRIWLVNVGDIKPLEIPINFFLDYAWNPDAWPAESLPDYYTQWAEEQFGNEYAQQIGEILALYTKYNSRRKPEMIDSNTYSLIYFNEAEKIVKDYNELADKAQIIARKLPANAFDAYYQLVLFPVIACANLNEMYVAAAKNHLYASQKRVTTNLYAEKVKECFTKDSILTEYYHTKLAEGKWNHMMSQIRIGYTYWNQPEKAVMPDVVKIKPQEQGKLAVTISGTKSYWPKSDSKAILSIFDPYNNQTQSIELFNQGENSVQYTIETENNWLKLSEKTGELKTDQQVEISIDWKIVPKGKYQTWLSVKDNKDSIKINVPVNNTVYTEAEGYLENNGIVSIEASDHQKTIKKGKINWVTIPNLGRTGSAVTPFPVKSPRQTLGNDSPRVEYEIFILDSGLYELTTYLSPTLNFMKKDGLHYAVSIDNDIPVTVNMHKDTSIPDWKYPPWWNNAVSNNIMIDTVLTKQLVPGKHTIKFWMVDPGVVLQKIVLKNYNNKSVSYLGPPKSNFIE